MQEKESKNGFSMDNLFLVFFKNLYFTYQEHQMEIFQNVPNK